MKPDTILLDRYQICEELSHKAGRRTFLARDLQNQQPVVLKILEFNQFFQWEDLKLFEREVQTLQNLDHPAIPKYLDSFEIEIENARGFALVQTYLDAPSLETVIQEGRKFSDTEIKEIAERLLEILRYLHEQNPPVIHRDIKPSNILLKNRSGNSVGEIYLVDFGSVQTVVSKESGTITIVGTYGYIPLEQFSGKTVPASDLFSLGMTLIYLITGVHPADLPQENGQVKIENIHLDRSFSRWLEKMTHPYLEKRYSSARSAIDALRSGNQNQGQDLDLKPANTRINLVYEENWLQIMIRDYYRSDNNSNWIILICFISLLLAIALGNLWVVIILSIIFILFAPENYGNYRVLYNNSLCEFSQIISIDKIQGVRIGKIYLPSSNFKEQKFLKIENIKLLVYNPGYTFDRALSPTGELVQGKNITIPARLYFHIELNDGKMVEYSLFDSPLSQAEYWWLAKEISEFLDLELAVIYPTPKLPSAPPPPSCGGCGCG